KTRSDGYGLVVDRADHHAVQLLARVQALTGELGVAEHEDADDLEPLARAVVVAHPERVLLVHTHVVDPLAAHLVALDARGELLEEPFVVAPGAVAADELEPDGLELVDGLVFERRHRRVEVTSGLGRGVRQCDLDQRFPRGCHARSPSSAARRAGGAAFARTVLSRARA